MADLPDTDNNAQLPLREVRFEHSPEFPEILERLGVSLLVSTYQAGKLVVIGMHNGRLALSFHNFSQAMGIAVHPDQIAVGGRTQIWSLKSTPEIARHWSDKGFDACYLARSSHITDEIHGHEMAWCDDELWIVNTRFSCLCTLEEGYSFVPRWRPPFISRLAPEDRCHLNGLCVQNSRPKYVTAMAETDTAGGWRLNKSETGCLIDVTSGQTVARGFAMPHSPRIFAERVWLLDSGRGQMVTVDPDVGTIDSVSAQPGYTRGLDFHSSYAFIGLSRIRETSTFSGVPIAEHRDSLKCGVALVDLRTGHHTAHFEFVSGVEEIFDVRVLSTAAHPYLAGPMAIAEGAEPIWYAPKTSIIPTRLDDTLSSSHVAAVPVHHDSKQEIAAKISPAAIERYDRGNRFAELDDFQQAAENFKQALAIEPEFAAAECNLGVALQFSGQIEESIGALRRAIKTKPDMAAAHMNLAMSLFLNGDFASAWPEYEWRWQCARFGKRPSAATDLAPVWKGESLQGKTVLIYGEQGIGDEVMFASCWGALESLAERYIVVCRSRLVPLFRRAFSSAIVVDEESLSEAKTQELLGSIDYQISAASAVPLLRPSLSFDSAVERYLRAEEGRRQHWAERLAELRPGRLVGVSWRGGREPAEIRRRSTQLSQWATVFEVDGVHFVNLQYGVRKTEVQEAHALAGGRFNSWAEIDPLSDMDEFAAIVSCLDLVISIDNSTVHLAGALGVPTWLLLAVPTSSSWRWLLEGDDCMWYRSLRVLRRPRHVEWPVFLQSVATELADWRDRASDSPM